MTTLEQLREEIRKAIYLRHHTVEEASDDAFRIFGLIDEFVSQATKEAVEGAKTKYQKTAMVLAEEKYEAILTWLLVKCLDGEGEINIPDIELMDIMEKYVVFRRQDLDRLCTTFKIIKELHPHSKDETPRKSGHSIDANGNCNLGCC